MQREWGSVVTVYSGAIMLHKQHLSNVSSKILSFIKKKKKKLNIKNKKTKTQLETNVFVLVLILVKH